MFLNSDKLEVFLREDGERGVRVVVPFKEGEYVCEYEANLLSKEDFEAAEVEYEEMDLPVYTLEVEPFVVL